MVFYSYETAIGLCLSVLPAIISIYTFFVLEKKKLSLGLLLLSAFFLRFLMSVVDPFLHNWDERFHALVAKNMMEFPFKPMLNKNPIIPFDYTDWSTNNIWLHKQPLFLWQMALSMKVFGVNELSMRLPSVLMGTISVYFIYKIAQFWFKDETVSYLAAFIFSLSNYQLELTSGRYALDHNDVAFCFYVTASIWAFTHYLYSEYKIKWSIVIGIFVGCAILNKWLTGALVYSAWGIYIFLDKNFRGDYKKYFHIFSSLITSCIVFLPWQIYIFKNFPLESQWEFNLNSRHISESLQGQHGGLFYHIRFLPVAYGYVLLIFLAEGLFFLLKEKKVEKNLSIAFLIMVSVLFVFFSLVVKTKMPAFVFPANAIIISVIAFGFSKFLNFMKEFNWNKIQLVLAVLILGYFDLDSYTIIKQSSKSLTERNSIINNTQIYKSLNSKIYADHIILNCKSFEDKDVMFYKNANAYAWFPDKKIFDSLQICGYKFLVFKNHNNQILPYYIQNNETVQFLQAQIK